MPVPIRLRRFLEAADADFQILDAGRVPSGLAARSVLLADERGYFVAVVPASRALALGALEAIRHASVSVASDGAGAALFDDCRPGSIPALARPYGLPIVVDEGVLASRDVYLEGGDGEGLVHMRAAEFLRLVAGAPRGAFTVRRESAAPGR
jgi:Ala-tRNA(Pro) deacylase